MNHLSNGEKDGIVLMYCKDKTLYPVGLTNEQVSRLDAILEISFSGTTLHVLMDKPQGSATNLKKAEQ